MRFIHFSDNEDGETRNKTYKVQPLLDKLKKFIEVYEPGATVIVDESIIPFRGRLSFRQYIKNKANPYGESNCSNCAPVMVLHVIYKFMLVNY